MKRKILFFIIAVVLFIGFSKISNAATISTDTVCYNAEYCKANCSSGLYEFDEGCDESGSCSPMYTCIKKKSDGKDCTENKNCVSGNCKSGKCDSGSGGTELQGGIICNSEADCASRCASGLSEYVDEASEAGVVSRNWFCKDQKTNGEPCAENRNCRSIYCDSSKKCAQNLNVSPNATPTPNAADIPNSENVFQGTRDFVNPIKVNNLEDFLSIVLSAVQKVVVTLALVFIVIGAFFILTSAGAPDMVERGKKIIAAAIIGLAIGIAAPSILKELAGILGWGTTTNATVNAALTISQIAVKVLNFLLGIAGIMSLIMLVIGGIIYLTSAGDEDRIANGKKIFTYSLLGIIIIFSAMVLVKQIALFFI